MFELAVRLKEETGADIRFINLRRYRGSVSSGSGDDILAIGDGVRKMYEEVLVPAGMGDVAIYTELGRFMMIPTGIS